VLILILALLSFRKGHRVLGLFGFVPGPVAVRRAAARPPLPLTARCGRSAGSSGRSARPTGSSSGKAALMAYYGLFALFYGRRRRRSAGLEGVQAEFTRADDRLAAR
jgi:hypothetical protein